MKITSQAFSKAQGQYFVSGRVNGVFVNSILEGAATDIEMFNDYCDNTDRQKQVEAFKYVDEKLKTAYYNTIW